MPKPFLPRELVIRTRNLLERVYGASSQVQSIPPYSIDSGSRTVKLDDQLIDLTSKEFDLLMYFVENQGLALSSRCLTIFGEMNILEQTEL